MIGAVGALAFYVWRRSLPSSVPLESRPPATPLADAISGAAWRTSDPLGWLWAVRIAQKEEEPL